MHRRWVLHCEEWPYRFIALIDSEQPWFEPCPRRAACAKEALEGRKVCQGPGTRVLVKALKPWLRKCVEEDGRISPDLVEHMAWFLSELP